MFFGSDHQPNDQLEKDEFREYEAEAIEPTTCDPTADYWAGRCNRWPSLSVMASVIQKPSKLLCACTLGTEPVKRGKTGSTGSLNSVLEPGLRTGFIFWLYPVWICLPMGYKTDDLRSDRSTPKINITYPIAPKATRSARGRALTSTTTKDSWNFIEQSSSKQLVVDSFWSSSQVSPITTVYGNEYISYCYDPILEFHRKEEENDESETTAAPRKPTTK
ncbi:hypothetical protein OUZ56_009981 [Daphnia magna]|uniref:Uncharacterized protein n=1 Tax=Daphnia magna TaxID=35525 RepID=A0ABR0AHG1_9CRUS|nr:hypothetical protein OUZ56_009981 [Daphnia magna]